MPFVTSFERNGMLRMIEGTLSAKFGEEGAKLMPAIRELNDAEKYVTLNLALATAMTLEDFRQAFAEAAAPPSRRKRKRPANGRRGQS